MYLHPLPLTMLALGLVVLHPFAPAAQAAMNYEEAKQTFDIGAVGADPASIWEAVRRFGPDTVGPGRAGATSGQLRWSPSVERTPIGCKIRRVDVTVSVTTTLPAWSNRYRASRKLQKYWDCLSTTAAAHEKNHARIWRDTGNRVDRELNAMTDWMACADIDEALKAKAQHIQSTARERHADVEQDGRHKRFEACAVEFKKPLAVADAKEETPEVESPHASADAADSAPPPAVRAGTRWRTASSEVVQATGTSLSLMFWIGGLLVGGMAGFVILMKHWLANGDEEMVETFKERSALLRLARRVDANTGGYVRRSRLPDKMGIRRRARSH